ncbi:DUF2267 domain-containing protein [Streptomyces sp. URMC 123]|uniref:DUF2267 domain-containing protein n=1 Tax=Streptomyces sp. URMC 123 TaxID=3423403 RepID=UPI003F195279
MTFDELVQAVKRDGLYPTAERAEEVTRAVLAALGAQLIGDERVDLAGVLPEEAARVFTSRIPATQPLTGGAFVDDLAAEISGSTTATARWDAGSVLGVVARLAGPALLRRVLLQLPPGYALLFGQAQLATPKVTGKAAPKVTGKVAATAGPAPVAPTVAAAEEPRPRAA